MGDHIIFYGDPHGDYAPLMKAVEEDRPDAVFILGDMTADGKAGETIIPISESLAPILDQGIFVKWIPGNHDSDTAEVYDATFGDMPEHNLHARVTSTPSGRLKIAGLGGVFRGSIWFPRKNIDEGSSVFSPEEYSENINHCHRWRGGVPLRHRASIFRSDAAVLQYQKADILITHEAPTSLDYGFRALDQLAEDLSAKVIIHGHHHHSYEGVLRNGVKVRGAGLRQPIRVKL